MTKVTNKRYYCNLCGEDFYCSVIEHIRECKDGRYEIDVGVAYDEVE